MTTKLPKRDVVVVGLGGAGGVAVVPLTEAGLDVVGLEPASIPGGGKDLRSGPLILWSFANGGWLIGLGQCLVGKL